jgi:hypothetical protein
VTGRYNAFPTGTSGTKPISLGLAATSDTAGLKSGTVTIDNLDVTTGGGADRGANDANDVFNISLSVLNHANPSFSAGSDVNSLTYDFGTLDQYAASPAFSFDVFNLSTTTGYTAGLDLDSVKPSEESYMLTSNLAPFSGTSTLAADSSKTFTVGVNTAFAGPFSATYTLSFSDENLSGATALGTMTLTLTGVVERQPDADFDRSGVVDGQDFLNWQQNVGFTSVEETHYLGDANHDKVVDGLDLVVWSGQFGVGGGAIRAVPEPGVVVVLQWAVVAATTLSRRSALRRMQWQSCGVSQDRGLAPRGC